MKENLKCPVRKLEKITKITNNYDETYQLLCHNLTLTEFIEVLQDINVQCNAGNSKVSIGTSYGEGFGRAKYIITPVHKDLTVIDIYWD